MELFSMKEQQAVFRDQQPTEGMIFLLIFALTTIAVNADHANQYGLRRSRQLDLGLQDINYSNEKTKTLDGNLPPVSSLKTVETQSRSSSSLAETEFFKKLFSKTETGVPKPSRDLVPPFNNLEQSAIQKSEPILTLKNEETTKTSSSDVNFSVFDFSTPRKITSRSQEATKPAETFVPSKTEATNELRSYLPPQESFSGAAQTSVQVVQPAPQNDDHDHHHGHHDHHHGDICADAFHSFLCTPLKARKRITGALPNTLRGQSSFVQYQKVLPNPDKDPAPSNAFQNEYLPPRSTPLPLVVSTSNIQSTYSPPQTTQRRVFPTTTTTTTTTPRPYSPPKFITEPSNKNDRFYLPPLSEHRDFLSVSPASSIQVNSQLPVSFSTPAPSTFPPPVISYQPIKVANSRPVVLPVITEKPKSVPVFTTPKSIFRYSQPNTILPSFKPLPFNEDRFYLPPNPNIKPESSFVSVTTLRPTTPPRPKISPFVPIQHNTIFISPLPKIISTTVIPETSVSFVPRPSSPIAFVSNSKPPRPIPTFVSQFSVPDSSYIPTKPKHQSPSNLISTTIKPVTTKKPLPVYSAQPATEDRSYLPSDPNVQPAAAQINAEAVAAPQTKNPFHHGRNLCTDPFHSFLCVGPKPRKRITGALPLGFRPESSNTNDLIVKPAPSFQNENKIKIDRPLETSPTQSLGYSYPKPFDLFPSMSSTTESPTTGYFYPKPEKIFPLPSQQQVVAKTTAKPAPPVVLRTSEARTVTGYDYPKPSNPFPSTTVAPTTGYSYPKPKKPFPLPTEQKEVVAAPANQPKGYQYPKPEQSFALPEKKGYSYPKPEKRLELPTESRSTSLPSPTNLKLDVLGSLGSAEFIPVNKLDKREEPRDSTGGNQKFGERLKKRSRRPSA